MALFTTPCRLPTVKIDLKQLPQSNNILIWLGHSSFYIQLSGKRILIDPVLSDYASPISWSTKAFKGTHIYDPKDFPNIDFLIISHDHWDHLDYPTVIALKDKIGNIICPLGTDAHFLRWGFPTKQIHSIVTRKLAILIARGIVTGPLGRFFCII